MSKEVYFRLQGEVWLADRDVNGNPGKTRWLFNAPKCNIAIKVDTDDVYESYSGLSLLDDQLPKTTGASLNLTLQGWSDENLSLGLYGNSASKASGHVAAEALPGGLLAGDYAQVAQRCVSNLVVTDSAGVPANVPAGNVALYRPNSGIVACIDPAAFVQPFKCAYDYDDYDIETMLTTTAPPERYLVFDGVNTRTGKPVVGELYRVKFQPLASMDMINDAHGSIDLTAALLYDRTRSADSLLGPFGRFIQQAA